MQSHELLGCLLEATMTGLIRSVQHNPERSLTHLPYLPKSTAIELSNAACQFKMPLETYSEAGLVLPESWEESEHEIINEFFDVKIPAALKEREAREPGFTSKGCSASDCLEYAKFLMQGMPLALANNQGFSSYTLTCPGRHRIIQFRTTELNTHVIDEAKQMYGDLVAKIARHRDFVLPVYTYNILPGQHHAWQQVTRDTFPLEREKRTVTDLGKFIATASHFPHAKDRYSESSWTLSANATMKRLEQNLSLKQIAPEICTMIASLSTKLYLLDTLPRVLTHLDLGSQNIFVEKDTGTITGVVNSDEARTEAFGINIFTLYERYVGSMENDHWSPFNMPAGEQYPGLSVSEVLTTAFWDSLWANAAPGLERKVLEEAVGVALRVGVINRYFVGGMLDEVDLENRMHVISLDYAREILQYLDKTEV